MRPPPLLDGQARARGADQEEHEQQLVARVERHDAATIALAA
jgi:hypothetical protein